jgi:transposase
VPIIDAMTGEVHDVHLFVAVLGASSYSYAEARWSETLPDWIGAHVNAFDFLRGVPRAAVSDYVPRHIIGLMCRPALCGRAAR